MKSIHQLKANERSRKWHQDFGHLLEVKERRRKTQLAWRKNNPEKYLLQHAKARAKERNVPFDLCEEDIQIPDVCPVFETPFEYGTPLSMSVDRKDPFKGYTRDNIQVISWKANMMKQDASPAQLKKFAEWVNRSIL